MENILIRKNFQMEFKLVSLRNSKSIKKIKQIKLISVRF